MDDPPIRSVETAVLTIPTDAPEADGTMAWNSTTLVLATVRAGDCTGLGFTYGPPACASVIKDQLASVIEGRSAMDVPAAAEAMAQAVRNAGQAGVAGYAISAVDVALWDLKARLLGLPLHRLLGSAGGVVPIYGSGGFTTYSDAQLETQLTRWTQDQGIGRVKIKIGESWGTRTDRDHTRMQQARNIIGDDVELYVDANGAYSAKQAIRVMAGCEDLGIRWYEEPVSSDDLAGLAMVRKAVAPDVAAGEYGTGIYYFRRMCEAQAVDCLQADVTRCGGITVWLKAAAIAASFNLELSGHCAPSMHAAVATAIPNLRHLEWFHDHVRIEAMLFDGALEPHAGALVPDPAAPGHGLALRDSVSETYRRS